MIGRRLTRSAVGFVLAAASAAVISLGSAPGAATAAPPEMLLSTDGVHFGPTLAAGLFDGLDLLVPGDSVDARFWVRNSSPDAGVIRIVVADLVVPSPAFASGITLTSNDGSQLRTSSLGELAACSVIVPSRTIAAGAIVRIDLTVRMLPTLVGLEAQDEVADLEFGVAMRDAASGPFPAVNGCASTTVPAAGPGGGLAFTGAIIIPTIAVAMALLVCGLLLFVVRRRHADDEEPSA
jgi:hypothetical protein